MKNLNEEDFLPPLISSINPDTYSSKVLDVSPKDLQNLSKAEIGDPQTYCSKVLKVSSEDLKNLSEDKMREIVAYYKLSPYNNTEIGEYERGFSKVLDDKLACKTVPINNAKDRAKVDNEIAVMKKLLGCDKVVQIKGFIEDIISFEEEKVQVIHIFMEACVGGDILERVLYMGDQYSEKVAKDLFREIVKVISICHQRGVIHRDLKVEHFMFCSKEENSVMKLIDFGECILFRSGEKFKSIVGDEPFGTIPYSAPEMLNFEQEHGQEADIWSLGVILCVLLIGTHPFGEDADEQEITQKIRECNINYDYGLWRHVSGDAQNLVKHILKKDPKDRISTSNILEHDWMRENDGMRELPSVITKMKEFQAKWWY